MWSQSLSGYPNWKSPSLFAPWCLIAQWVTLNWFPTSARLPPSLHLVLLLGPLGWGAQFGVALEEQAIQANTPAALAALPLNFLLPLQRQLRGTHAEWDSAARIGRVLSSRCSCLDGQLRPEVSLDLPYRKHLLHCSSRPKEVHLVFGPVGLQSTNPLVASRDHPVALNQSLSATHSLRASRAEAASLPGRGQEGMATRSVCPHPQVELDGCKPTWASPTPSSALLSH